MNRVNLSGYMASDIKIATTKNGHKRGNFQLAVARYNKQADFFPCEAWDINAENIEKYFGKGKGIEIEGNLLSSKIKSQDNDKERTIIKVNVTNWEFPKSNKTDDRIASVIPEFDATVNVDNDDEVPFA